MVERAAPGAVSPGVDGDTVAHCLGVRRRERLVLDQPAVPFSGWTAAAVLAGVGQVLAGSLAYLIPVLIGAPLASDVNRMTHRPLIPLFAANLTGLALVIGWELGAVIFGAAWVIDLAIRLARTVGSSRRGPDDAADTKD